MVHIFVALEKLHLAHCAHLVHDIVDGKNEAKCLNGDAGDGSEKMKQVESFEEEVR